jgi:hypothetical protein
MTAEEAARLVEQVSGAKKAASRGCVFALALLFVCSVAVLAIVALFKFVFVYPW